MKAQTKTTHDRRYEVLGICLVLLAAAIIRAVYLLQYKANVPYYSELIVDARYYDEWAQKVAAGKGYGPLPFYMAPFYPYVIAGIYKLVGHSVTVIYVFQAILGLVNTYLVYLLGRRFFGHVSGLVAMALVSLYAPLVYLESKVLTETLAITLNLIAILLLLRVLERPKPTGFLISGIVLGLSAVCRPNAMLTIALFVLWLILRGRRQPGFWMRRLAPLLIGAALAIFPVTARNYILGKDLVLLTSNGGIVFYQANNPGADGVSTALSNFSLSIMTQQNEEMAIAEKALGRPVKPSESAAYWFGQSLGFIKERPGAFLVLLGRKALWLLHNVEARCSFNVYLEKSLVPALRLLAMPFSLLAGLALFGWIRSRRSGLRETDLLGLYVLSIFLNLIIFYVSSRYRVPAIPVLAVFAGFGAVELAAIVRSRNVRRLVVPVACLVGMHLFSFVPYPIPLITAGSYNNLGAALARQSRYKEAIEYYRMAVRVKPEYAVAHRNLGVALAALGKMDDAEQSFRESVRLRPEDPGAYLGLAGVLRRKGDIEGAVAQYLAAVSIEPERADIRLAFGLFLVEQGRVKDAIPLYRAAVRLRPGDANAHFNLGSLLGQTGRLDEEIEQYRRAIELNPKLAEAHGNLAIALYYKGRYREAWDEAELCRRYGATPNPDFIRALSEKMQQP